MAILLPVWRMGSDNPLSAQFFRRFMQFHIMPTRGKHSRRLHTGQTASRDENALSAQRRGKRVEFRFAQHSRIDRTAYATRFDILAGGEREAVQASCAAPYFPGVSLPDFFRPEGINKQRPPQGNEIRVAPFKHRLRHVRITQLARGNDRAVHGIAHGPVKIPRIGIRVEISAGCIPDTFLRSAHDLDAVGSRDIQHGGHAHAFLRLYAPLS